MIKDKCCREINDSLHKTFAKSVLNKFASNLGIDINNEEGEQERVKDPQEVRDVKFDVNEEEQESSENEAEDEKRQQFLRFSQATREKDIKTQAQILKGFSTTTPQDQEMHKRQKNGQLRFGDVICLGYHEDVYLNDGSGLAGVPGVELTPDYKYKGLLYSDGVTDKGIKMIPQASYNSQNASTLFKQCLFRLEVVQDCEVNKRAFNLNALRNDLEKQLKKMIKDAKGEQNVDDQKLAAIKKEIEVAVDDIKKNEERRVIQEENNAYNQKYRHGTKLTYGMPFQLKHLFSDRYLTLNINEMSQEYGSCDLYLHESTEHGQFVIQPSQQTQNTSGYVVNYQDYFCIRSLNSSTPFNVHAYEKPNNQYSKQKGFLINASLVPSAFKAKLFMSFSESIKSKDYIQSGDVVRLKHSKGGGYLSTSSLVVDDLLPDVPDFLKHQIQRTYKNQQPIEQNVGGRDLNEKEKQKQDKTSDGFKTEFVNDDYVKRLKEKTHEHIYIEMNKNRTKFTNSCWEIQRVNPLNGGNIIQEEVIRFRHVGTSKFLAINKDDGLSLQLSNSNYDLETLFLLKSDMSNKTPTRHLDEDGDGVADDVKLMQNHQRIIIQSFYSERYLQLLEDFEEEGQEDYMTDVNEGEISFKQDDPDQSKLNIICHEFLKQGKQKMVFVIEEVNEKEAIQSYQSSCMFDELLEYYCFLNQWGVHKIEHEDTFEKYFLKPQKAVELKDVLLAKTSVMQFIIGNLNNIIKDCQAKRQEQELGKLKEEISDQGILDILLCIVEMLYYKTTPPSMFHGPFQKRLIPEKRGNKDESSEQLQIKIILEYTAQNIAREATSALLLEILNIVLELVHTQKNNSEKLTKYFGALFQQFTIHQQYEILLHNNTTLRFKALNPRGFQTLIGQIFINSQRDAVYVLKDRSIYTVMKAREEVLKSNKNKASTKFNSDLAIAGITSGINEKKTLDPRLVQKWADLLGTVRYNNEFNQNLENQIMCLEMLSNYCIDGKGRGVYPYQRQISNIIFASEDRYLIRFGTAKVDGNLRPYLYFVRPPEMSRQQFLDRNPLLGQIHNTENMQQHNNQKAQFDLIFDLHELTSNYEKTKPFIDYICAVVNLYGYLCLSSNQDAINHVGKTGLTDSHISLCINQDKETLIIHEKLKTAYMFLARCMFIENDPIYSSIQNKNRCYVWDRIRVGGQRSNQQVGDDYFVDLIEDDQYAGKTRKKFTTLDDLTNPMIMLTAEQDSLNMQVILLIQKSVFWFLNHGPFGIIAFFAHNSRRNFTAKSIETKLRALEVYLDTIYAIIQRDLVDDHFIDRSNFICTVVQFGALHFQLEKENRIPFVIKSNWVYQLMWVSKEIVKSTGSALIEDFNNSIECRALDIVNKVAFYKLNNQCKICLQKFRQFQEKAFNEIETEENQEYQMEQNFDEIFATTSDLEKPFLKELDEEKREQIKNHAQCCQNEQNSTCFAQQMLVGVTQSENHKSIQFEFFLDYIFDKDTRIEVREKAMESLILQFNQKDLLAKQLIATNIIVTDDDYETFLYFLSKQRVLKSLIDQMIQNETTQTIFNEKPSQEVKNIKNQIKEIVININDKLISYEPLKKRRIQNMIRHISLIEDLMNSLLKRLVEKMFYYRDLFQAIVDFLLTLCTSNPGCQKLMLADINFFVDMINQRIESGLLISEIIKVNSGSEDSSSFVNYLIQKIVNEGYFKSSLFKLLIKLANIDQNCEEGEIPRSINENSNQQFILKQMVSTSKFRSLILMKHQFTATKIGRIKAYVIKREQHNYMCQDRELDTNLLKDKEALDLHLAVIDLIASCAKNNSYGISQAQQLISLDELLDSILSDAIPFLVKKHYLNLLFEIYLRKVEGIDATNRLNLSNVKLQQVLERVIENDLDMCFQHYEGLIKQVQPKTQEAQKAFRMCVRDVRKVKENEQDDKALLKIQKRNEKGSNEDLTMTPQPALGSGWTDAIAIPNLDSADLSEYWNYLYDSHDISSKLFGLLGFIEHFYNDYNEKDLGDDEILLNISYNIRQKLLNLANKIFLFVDSHEEFIKEECHQILVSINRAIQQIPNLTRFQNEENIELDMSRRVDNRMSGDKIIRIASVYIMHKGISIREALGIREDITSESHMISRNDLKYTLIKVSQNQANYDDIEKALEYFQLISLERKQEEAGEVGYMIEDEFDPQQMDLVDIEVKIRDFLQKQGYDIDLQDEMRAGKAGFIKSKDLSVAINIDMGLYSQRFLEFIHSNKHQIEIHTFVDQLMHSNFTVDRYAKIKLVKDLLQGFTGLSGTDDDELILISVLSLIIQRLIPQEIDSQQTASLTLLGIKKKNRVNDRLSEELEEWQNVMFEAGVPELMLSIININNSTYLANNALMLVNRLLFDPHEENQQKILDVLRLGDKFFDVFYYLKQRFEISKKIILGKIQKSAEKKFESESVYSSERNDSTSQVFQDTDWFTDKKYDLQYKYDELLDTWQSEEMTTLLQFLNSLCENCFKPAQIFLKKQVDDEENFKDQKKITSIDLIYQVVVCFTDIVDTVGDYVFSDYRTFAMLPLIIDTLQEFIYGPCIENQIFLGESKKFVSVINSLMDQHENGNYSGIHQQAKAQLKMLFACSQLLLAIVDIKNPEKAQIVHNVMLDELDIENLVKKMTEIYSYRVGGDPERKLIYEFNQQCTHLKIDDEDPRRCIQDEFCEHKQLIPRDNDTIQTGFNIYQILQILRTSNPNHKRIKCFIRDEGGFSFLKKTEGNDLKQRIYTNYKLSSQKTLSVYNRFNKIEVMLLDQLIIIIYPELYIAYLEKVIELQKVNKMLDKDLEEKLKIVKTVKSSFDRQRILERLPQILRYNYLQKRREKDPCSKIYNYGQLLEKQGYPVEQKEVLIEQMQQREHKVDEHDEGKSVDTIDDEAMKRKIKMYEFHLAGNFYEDNIGKVEIQRESIGAEEDLELAETTFKLPSYCKHLTVQTREKIPSLLTKVSQQEKLENFVEVIEKLEVEMKWQQSLGRISYGLKKWSNQWNFLSYVNFGLVFFINVFFVLFLQLNPQGDNTNPFIFSESWQQLLISVVGYIQTCVAAIVVFAYYLDSRATLKFDIQQNQIEKLGKVEGYGLNYGSFGYGRKKAHKFEDLVLQDDTIDALQGIAQSAFIFQALNLVIKEVIVFIKSLNDKDHKRNIGYLLVSMYSNTDNGYLFSAALMIDVIFKIKTLSQVLSIFGENMVALVSVLALFVVVLYIFAFVGFIAFKDDFQHSLPTSDMDTIYHQNPYQMYCETLIQCLTSTAQYGIRSGGGVGDALNNATFGDKHYYTRYFYDFFFFMLLNIILMNIFFGIIIDSFAEKRAAEGEIDEEVQGQCFICGISRSKFEIVNVSWLNHIYCVHNLHSYVAFIIYVKQKSYSECTGVEKWCKTCLDQGVIEFFPIARTAAIDGGCKVEETSED